MILIINTADNKRVFIGLFDKGKLVAKKQFQARYRQAEKLLPQINRLLESRSHRLKDIKGIAVVNGPGPFTALRIGVATANTLAWALKTPIAGIKLSEFKNIDDLVEVSEVKIKKARPGHIISPFYGQKPNITLRK